MIYLDNSATTHKKPESVIYAMTNYMRNECANPGRGGHRLSLKSAETVYMCRCEIAKMFGIENAENIVFTLNATDSLNMVIKGFLKEGDHAVFSSMEHNSVVRPFYALKNKNIDFSIAYADKFGYVNCEAILKEIKPNTRLVCITHASNVCGTVNDIYEIGKMLKEKNIKFLVDASQSGGIIDIDVEKCNIDFLALTGHKALMGPQGVGVLYVKDANFLETIKEGGTGSMSSITSMPDYMPDKFESGTLNTVGIAGLLEGVKFIRKVGLDTINMHETNLTRMLLDDLSVIKNVRIFGYLTTVRRIGVVSINFLNNDVLSVADILDKDYGICVRAGYHCAYMAHKTIGSEKEGTLRLSIGAFNTKNDIKTAVYAINKIIK
ncbi:MAG: aminotransferase class V-fold PLP-dependent enzyme [Ruminococcaceae bacterium]|nr:aminotransferase class V-fold PLP-dependent enzyme [Oscillospiraceae bacterium]